MLIATDLDGTLVPSGAPTVTAFTADVLRRVDAAGIPVVFVTARPLRWMDGLWPHVGEHGLAIVSNGAITYDVASRTPLAVHGISAGDGLALTAAITAAVPGATFAIECLDGIRMDPAYADEHAPPVGAPRGPLAEVWDAPAVKLLVHDPSTEPDAFREAVTRAVVTKARALVELCGRLRVGADDGVAFGDMPNDIAMLSWAGTSYAMTGAHDSVVAVADHLAPPVEQDGVARVLASLLDGRP